MIRWSTEFYMDENIGKKPEKWKKRVECGKWSLNLYCICLAANENNLFDIINCNELLFKYYKRSDLYIVGLARTREDAIDLLQDILENILAKTHDLKVREYFIFQKK